MEAPIEDEFVQNKISLDELIKVVSLIDYPLNLLPQGQNAGGRAKYRFENLVKPSKSSIKIFFKSLNNIVPLWKRVSS